MCSFLLSLADCRAYLSNNNFKLYQYPMSSEYSEVLYYPRPAYGPSELNTFPPPYPLSHLDPIISVAAYVCSVCLDHYKIANA